MIVTEERIVGRRSEAIERLLGIMTRDSDEEEEAAVEMDGG